MPATTLADLLASITREPGRPRLTWYGADGERVELSGAVLDNWIAKTTNLLVEEFDAAPGTRVLVDLPPHWRTVVWTLAIWRAGACAVLDEADPTLAAHVDHTDPEAGPVGEVFPRRTPVDVVVTDRPGVHLGGAPVVAVALPALARRFDADLPPGALDAASAVMTYGDVIGWTEPLDPTAPAADTGRYTVAHSEMLAHAAQTFAGLDVGTRPRVLVGTGPVRADSLAMLLTTLAVLQRDGSVVLLRRPTGDETGAGPASAGALDDAARRARIIASERVTVNLVDLDRA